MGGVVDHKLVETEQHPQGYRPIKEKTVLKPRQSDSRVCLFLHYPLLPLCVMLKGAWSRKGRKQNLGQLHRLALERGKKPRETAMSVSGHESGEAVGLCGTGAL